MFVQTLLDVITMHLVWIPFMPLASIVHKNREVMGWVSFYNDIVRCIISKGSYDFG